MAANNTTPKFLNNPMAEAAVESDNKHIMHQFLRKGTALTLQDINNPLMTVLTNPNPNDPNVQPDLPPQPLPEPAPER